MKKVTVIFLSAFLSINFYSGSLANGTLILTEINNNSTVTLKIGQKLNLTLKSNPTTGYSWEYSKKPDKTVLKEISHTYKQDQVKSGKGATIVGAGGKDTWYYEVTGTGKTTMELKYIRSWEPDKAADNYKITIIAVPDTNEINTIISKEIRSYSLSMSSFPGMPLIAKVTGAKNLSSYKFKWQTDKGSLLLWGSPDFKVINKGKTLVTDNRKVYYSPLQNNTGNAYTVNITLSLLDSKNRIVSVGKLQLKVSKEGNVS